MNIWLKQHTNIKTIPDGWRACIATLTKDRVFINDKIDNNQLVNCSRAFFAAEIAKGRIICERI